MANSAEEWACPPITKKLFFTRQSLTKDWIRNVSKTSLCYIGKQLWHIEDMSLGSVIGDSLDVSHLKIHRYTRAIGHVSSDGTIYNVGDDGSFHRLKSDNSYEKVFVEDNCVERIINVSVKDSLPVLLVHCPKSEMGKGSGFHEMSFYCKYILVKDIRVGDVVDLCDDWQMVLEIKVENGLFSLRTHCGFLHIGFSGYTRLLRAINSAF